VVLIGHSLGGNNAIAAAARLGQAGVIVHLVVTIDPTAPPPVPANVRRAVNYFLSAPQSGLPQGVAIAAGAGFRGQISNADLSTGRPDLAGDGLTHTSIDVRPAGRPAPMNVRDPGRMRSAPSASRHFNRFGVTLRQAWAQK
jgi:pimeloyl-ACP methyl ester carboxylesterase